MINATQTAENDTLELNAAHFTGSKFVEGIGTAAIAKCIRSDIKAAIKSGLLPAGLETSVRLSRYSGGSSIRVEITACPSLTICDIDFARFTIETDNRQHYAHERHTVAARTLVAKLKVIVNAYREDRSDAQVDYFCVNFYGHVAFAFEFEKADRAALDASLRAVAELAAL